MSDQAYFEQLWLEVEGQVLRIASVLTGTATGRGRREDSEDLVQDVRIKCFRRFHRFLLDPRNFGAWVTRIMQRTWIDSYNKTKKRNEVSLNSTIHLDSQYDDSPGSDPQHEEMFIDGRDDHSLTEEILVIAAELKDLDPILAADLILRTGYGYTIAEAASVLGMTPVALKSRIDRAKRDRAPRQKARMAQRSTLWRKLSR